MCDFYLSFKVLCFFFGKRVSLQRDDRMKVIVSLNLITRCAFGFFSLFSFVLLLTWQHENKSLSTCYLFRVCSFEIQSALVCQQSRGSCLFYQADDDRSNEEKITAAFYKCLPFKLLSWHLREQESRKKRVDGLIRERANISCWICHQASKQAYIHKNKQWITQNVSVHSAYQIEPHTFRYYYFYFYFDQRNTFCGCNMEIALAGSYAGFRFVAPLVNIIAYIYRF